MDMPTKLHLITVTAVLIFKILSLCVGLIITWMGYKLLVKGVTGEFNFKSNFNGFTSDLASASPGLLFVVLGSSLIAFAVLKDKKFETDVGGASSAENSENPTPLPDLSGLPSSSKK